MQVNGGSSSDGFYDGSGWYQDEYGEWQQDPNMDSNQPHQMQPPQAPPPPGMDPNQMPQTGQAQFQPGMDQNQMPPNGLASFPSMDPGSQFPPPDQMQPQQPPPPGAQFPPSDQMQSTGQFPEQFPSMTDQNQFPNQNGPIIISETGQQLPLQPSPMPPPFNPQQQQQLPMNDPNMAMGPQSLDATGSSFGLFQQQQQQQQQQPPPSQQPLSDPQQFGFVNDLNKRNASNFNLSLPHNVAQDAFIPYGPEPDPGWGYQDEFGQWHPSEGPSPYVVKSQQQQQQQQQQSNFMASDTNRNNNSLSNKKPDNYEEGWYMDESGEWLNEFDWHQDENGEWYYEDSYDYEADGWVQDENGDWYQEDPASLRNADEEQKAFKGLSRLGSTKVNKEEEERLQKEKVKLEEQQKVQIKQALILDHEKKIIVRTRQQLDVERKRQLNERQRLQRIEDVRRRKEEQERVRKERQKKLDEQERLRRVQHQQLRISQAQAKEKMRLQKAQEVLRRQTQLQKEIIRKQQEQIRVHSVRTQLQLEQERKKTQQRLLDERQRLQNELDQDKIRHVQELQLRQKQQELQWKQQKLKADELARERALFDKRAKQQIENLAKQHKALADDLLKKQTAEMDKQEADEIAKKLAAEELAKKMAVEATAEERKKLEKEKKEAEKDLADAKKTIAEESARRKAAEEWANKTCELAEVRKKVSTTTTAAGPSHGPSTAASRKGSVSVASLPKKSNGGSKEDSVHLMSVDQSPVTSPPLPKDDEYKADDEGATEKLPPRPADYDDYWYEDDDGVWRNEYDDYGYEFDPYNYEEFDAEEGVKSEGASAPRTPQPSSPFVVNDRSRKSSVKSERSHTHSLSKRSSLAPATPKTISRRESVTVASRRDSIASKRDALVLPLTSPQVDNQQLQEEKLPPRPADYDDYWYEDEDGNWRNEYDDYGYEFDEDEYEKEEDFYTEEEIQQAEQEMGIKSKRSSTSAVIEDQQVPDWNNQG